MPLVCHNEPSPTAALVSDQSLQSLAVCSCSWPPALTCCGQHMMPRKLSLAVANVCFCALMRTTSQCIEAHNPERLLVQTASLLHMCQVRFCN